MNLRILSLGLFLTGAVLGQSLPVVILDVETDNCVTYRHDNADPLAQAKQPGPTTSPAPTNFFWTNSIQDVRFVNGRPARGVAVFQTYRINLNPTPPAGSAIADIVRGTAIHLTMEIQQEDGTPVGSLMMIGVGGGPPPPGSPGGLAFNLAIVGGTGAFVGARGHMVSKFNTVIPERPIPTRSATEDPATRRTLPSGTGASRLYLIPALVPIIQAALHADFTPVTPENPAKPGETVILRATGLGPTQPPTEYGAPFPEDPVASVNSPVEVRMAGGDLLPVNKLGWPATTDSYRVDFRVPDDAAPGNTPIRVVAAFVPGAEFMLPVAK